MGDYERVPVEDWADVTDHLRELAADGEVSESDEGVEITVGSATFLVTKDGRVSAGMPLHDFEDGEVEVLYFDHDRGAVRVENGDRSYEFRAPS
ncbi:hypothetical protein [Halorussus aquaticus]|uniref:Halobacterial output domain-containing protein n=1 Tax=Halorussus aquaticus TaxID=2953748 RepID=A0ABD5Q1Y5_9EURY|nr:hypothetical protein [Halorussus aquaticus]